MYVELTLLSWVFTGTSYCLFILMCLVAAVRSWLISQIFTTNSDGSGKHADQQQPAKDSYEHFNGSVVPALHMGACFCVSIVQLVWSLSPTKLSGDTNTAFNICVIFANAFVIVIEMRVRQSEVMHGLDQLQSKRAFVRFVLHEVRTPLSTASMGLELMANARLLNTSHLSGQNGPISKADRDEFSEELGLVQESLHAAESIFNDLVAYDALGSESEQLTLVYTPMRLSALVRQALGPLTLQARRGGVVLRELLCEAGADAAVVDVDQRRIAQAVRTVIAGAIGAAPKGSEVVVTLRLSSAAAARRSSAASSGRWWANIDTGASPTATVAAAAARGSRWSSWDAQRPRVAGTATKKSLFRRVKVLAGTPDAGATAASGIADMVVLEVAHGGVGFEPSDTKAAMQHAFAFNPNQLHGSGTAGGTGSGLSMAITKTIVEAQGGFVWLQSDGADKGASFVMALHLSAAAVPAADQPHSYTARQAHALSLPAHDPHGGSAVPSATASPALPQWQVATAKTVERVEEPSAGGGHRHMPPEKDSAGAAAEGPSAVNAEPLGEAAVAGAASLVPFAPAPGLPLASTGTATPAADDVAEVGAEGGPSFAHIPEGTHVLVVEDSPVARMMLVRLLKSIGYSTAEAEDGQVTWGHTTRRLHVALPVLLLLLLLCTMYQVAVRMVKESLHDTSPHSSQKYGAILCGT